MEKVKKKVESKIIHKAYKFRLKPSDDQKKQFAQIAGVCRLVWNLCLEQRTTIYSSSRKSLNVCNQLPEVSQLRHEYDWIKDIPSQVLQQKVRDLDVAYKNFFEGHAEFPARKKKGKSIDSFRFPQGFQIDNRRIFLPKVGWVGFFKSQSIEGKLRHVTVSRNGNHWFASVSCEVAIPLTGETSPDASPKPTAVGIDMGIAKLCAMSNGQIIENPRTLNQYNDKLVKLQRKLAKKKKGSSNFKKLKRRIAAVHAKIANTRRDHIHKATTSIAKNHGLVVLEDLRVKDMSKSAKGGIDNPGRNVRQKAGLNRSILDAGWGEFRRQLEYKFAWANGIVVAVDPKNTSRKCPVCGHTAKENRVTQADFVCARCGHADDADVNAAINILRAGHARIACGEIGAVRPLDEAGTPKAA